MASGAGHRDQELSKLNGQIVLIGVELPTDPFCSRGRQIARKFL